MSVLKGARVAEENGPPSLGDVRQKKLRELVVDSTWEPLGGYTHKNCGGQAVRCPETATIWACSTCKKPTDNIIVEFVPKARPAWKADEGIEIEK